MKFVKFQYSDSLKGLNDQYPIKSIYRHKYDDDKETINFPGIKKKMILYDNHTKSNKIFTGYVINRNELNKYINKNEKLLPKSKTNHIETLMLYKEIPDNSNIWQYQEKKYYDMNELNDIKDYLLLQNHNILLVKDS